MVEKCDEIALKLQKEDHHADLQWKVLLPRTRLGPGQRHFFSFQDNNLNNASCFNHLYCSNNDLLNFYWLDWPCITFENYNFPRWWSDAS
jgi:hypothetical protein